MFKKAFIISLLSLQCAVIYCGPPFITDDPEPVEFKHWEFYISTIDQLLPGNLSGTLPHFETNYGLLPNVQIHLLLPFNYSFETHQKIRYGYAYSEVGIKYRFIKENDYIPQIGTFPIIEIPTIQNKTFSNNKMQIYFPIWIQKSWNKFTTYGGGGYWINPGTGNKNWIYSGWLLQYDFSKFVTIGGELFYHSSVSIGEGNLMGFNLGGYVNFSEKLHFIYSAGHNFYSRGNLYMIYAGLLWTI